MLGPLLGLWNGCLAPVPSSPHGTAQHRPHCSASWCFVLWVDQLSSEGGLRFELDKVHPRGSRGGGASQSFACCSSPKEPYGDLITAAEPAVRSTKAGAEQIRLKVLAALAKAKQKLT